MNQNVFFSIILPTYNREKKILKAINSVVAQTFKNWELIIIDNKSNDETEKIVKSFKSKKIFFHQIENRGVIAKSRNYGISKSSGNYLCFLDSDDWWDKDKLKYVNLAAEKGYSFIYHDHYVCTPNRLIKKRKIISKPLAKPVFINLIKYGPFFATSSVVVEKNIFKKINCFDTDKKYIAWEDWDAWLRMSKITDSFCKVDKTLSTVLVDGKNLLDSNLVIKNMKLFFEKYIKSDQQIPEWCLYSLLSSEYKLGLYKETKETLKKINFFKLNNFQKINYIKIKAITFFK
jgi:glycosyltransferase involved in cell wall biosynthesis|tara:strand:- start:5299 stop:6165 length:867 start_codon:yes stop_codon:yes gene_type:complete